MTDTNDLPRVEQLLITALATGHPVRDLIERFPRYADVIRELFDDILSRALISTTDDLERALCPSGDLRRVFDEFLENQDYEECFEIRDRIFKYPFGRVVFVTITDLTVAKVDVIDAIADALEQHMASETGERDGSDGKTAIISCVQRRNEIQHALTVPLANETGLVPKKPWPAFAPLVS
jgi:hypothetical protein